MRRLQSSIIYLLILLTILFNIERLDVGGTNVNNLATAVYVLTIIAVLMIITIKWFRKIPQPIFLLLWGAAFFFTKATTISHRPLMGDIYTYLTFTELSFFMVAVLLAQNLARNLWDFERGVNNFAFTNLTRIKHVEDAQEKIQAEIYRSRRFQRPLSLVVLEKDWKGVPLNSKARQDAQRALMEEYLSAMMIRELTVQLRQTDLLLEHNKKGRLIIVSPDTDQTGINNLIERLTPLVETEAIAVNFGAATFPGHGLTFEQLLEWAEKDLQQRMGNLVNPASSEALEEDHALNVP